jgi:hypothetical protein
MRGISRTIAELLNTNVEFLALSNSLLSSEFTYYVNIDFTQVELELPYFGIVTFMDSDEADITKSFKTQLLIGIRREQAVMSGSISEEPTLDKLESLSRKAVELIRKDVRAFGVQGEKNIKITYVSFYVLEPDGEIDLQMQVDIIFEQDKFLSC